MIPQTGQISLTVNGEQVTATVPVRRNLVDFLRSDLGLTGSHVGCEHGVCGACTIEVDGAMIRGCLMLAVQADGAELTTVEGLGREGKLHPIQEAFVEEHGLQCGFCTPAMMLVGAALLEQNASPTEEEVRWAISGNLCRCTGYQNIVKSIRAAGERVAAGSS